MELHEDEQIQLLYQYASVAEANEAMAHMHGFLTAEDTIGTRLGQLLPRLSPHNVEYLRTFVRAAYRATGVESREIERQAKVRYFMNSLIGIVENGSLVRLWGIKRDFTDRRRAEERVQRLLSQQIAVNQLALALGETRDLGTILHVVYEHVRALVDADAFIVSFYDSATKLIHAGYVVNSGEVRDVSDYPPIPLEGVGQGTQSQVIRTGAPLYVPNYREVMESTRTEYTIQEDGAIEEGPPPPEERRSSTNSALYVPMKIAGETIGVMQVQSHRLDGYSPDDVDVLASMANVAAVAIQNVRLYDAVQHELGARQRAEEQIRLQVERLSALHNIDMAITASFDLRVTLDVLLDQVIAQLAVDAADVLLLNPHTQTLECAARRGFRTTALQHTRLRLGEGLAGRAALERRTISDFRLRTADSSSEQSEIRIPQSAIEAEAFTSYCGVPLIAKGEVKGVLEIFHRAPLDPDPEWLRFLDSLAGQAAIAIDSATLFNDLQRSNMELALAYDTTLEGWARALELRDYETEGHCRSVTELTVRVARAMDISDAELVHVRRGALLHDVGKMGLPDSILLKPGPLTDAEWDVMRQHPVYAYEMLSSIGFLRRALDIPYCHHERWDGSGYPQGLKGEQIPLAARVFAVVDVWDALLSDRPYRDAWPEERVLEHIREQAGKHFDPRVVEVFLGLGVDRGQHLHGEAASCQEGAWA